MRFLLLRIILHFSEPPAGRRSQTPANYCSANFVNPLPFLSSDE